MLSTQPSPFDGYPIKAGRPEATKEPRTPSSSIKDRLGKSIAKRPERENKNGGFPGHTNSAFHLDLTNYQAITTMRGRRGRISCSKNVKENREIVPACLYIYKLRSAALRTVHLVDGHSAGQRGLLDVVHRVGGLVLVDLLRLGLEVLFQAGAEVH